MSYILHTGSHYFILQDRTRESMKSSLTYTLSSRILLSATLLVTLSAQAQPISFERIVTPTIPIIDFAQDHRGFIWMAGDGLHRYDGHRFISYYHDPGDSTSLSNNRITSIFVDSRGTLWVGTDRPEAYLHRFDPKTKSFIKFSMQSKEDRQVHQNGVYGMMEDREGYLWVAGDNAELYRFDRDTETIDVYTLPPGDSLYVMDILEDRHGGIWAISGDWTFDHPGGLYRLDRVSNAFIEIDVNTENSGQTLPFEVFSIHEDREGIFWLGVWPQGLTRYDPLTGQSKTYKNPYSELPKLHDIHEDRNGKLWLAYEGKIGLNQFDRKAESFTLFENEYEPSTKRYANIAFKIFEDRQGTLWVSYRGNQIETSHVYKVVRAPGQFLYYNHEPDNPLSLRPHNNIASFHEDSDGTMWVGAFNGGLNRFDMKDQSFANYTYKPGGPDNPPSGSIVSILEDRKGTLWLGTFFPGLHQFNQEEKSFTHTHNYLDKINSLVENGVIEILEDRFGELWFGTWQDGLIRFDPESGATTKYIHNPDDETSLSGNIVAHMIEDRDGNLWVAAYDGDVITRRTTTHRFDRQTETFERFEPGEIFDFIDRAGYFWGFSNTHGIVRWDRDSNTRKYYSMSDGLPSNRVQCALQDSSGNLWISTMAGLSRLVPETGVFRNFTHGIDLTNASFSTGPSTCYRTRDGTFYFGQTPGFTTFHPDEFEFNTIPPDIAITEIQAGEEVIQSDDASFPQKPGVTSEGLRLTHRQNDLSIEYVGLHFEDPSRNAYRYKLEPHNEDWVEAGTERQARFFQVRPGTYTFSVQAANPNGNWNEIGTSIALTILPPWWRTEWAYFVYGVLLAGVLIAANRIQRRRLISHEREQARIQLAKLEAQSATERAEMAERLEEVKSRFFVNISHEFRTPLTLILGPLKDALSGAYGAVEGRLLHPLRTMQRNGDRLLQLINQLLDFEKLEAGGLHLQTKEIDLVAFARALTLSFTSRAEREQKSLKFETHKPLLGVYFDQVKLEKVIYNLLSNAFKFSSAGDTIQVTVYAQENAAHITVQDTGEGIPPAELSHIFDRFYQAGGTSSNRHGGSGIGLALAKELVELHGGSIDVESREGEGSLFTIELPLGRAHLRDEDVVVEEASHESEVRVENQAISFAEDRDPVPVETSDELATILIVEDNPDLRDYLRTHLSGYAIVEAENGQEGLEKALESLPDLVISDVMMPVMDGVALCEALRKNEKTQDVPVILLTAKATEEHKIEGLQAGADDYLYKPFSAKELLARTENLIDLRRQLRSRYRSEVVLKPADVAVSSVDAAFIENVRSIVEEQMGDSWFGVERLAQEVGLSRRQLQRRINTLLQTTASTFIRDMRLERAMQLLEKKAGNISEISYTVGYNDPSHFSMLFKKKYGHSPSEWQEKPANH